MLVANAAACRIDSASGMGVLVSSCGMVSDAVGGGGNIEATRTEAGRSGKEEPEEEEEEGDEEGGQWTLVAVPWCELLKPIFCSMYNSSSSLCRVALPSNVCEELTWPNISFILFVGVAAIDCVFGDAELIDDSAPPPPVASACE